MSSSSSSSTDAQTTVPLAVRGASARCLSAPVLGSQHVKFKQPTGILSGFAEKKNKKIPRKKTRNKITPTITNKIHLIFESFAFLNN